MNDLNHIYKVGNLICRLRVEKTSKSDAQIVLKYFN